MGNSSFPLLSCFTHLCPLLAHKGNQDTVTEALRAMGGGCPTVMRGESWGKAGLGPEEPDSSSSSALNAQTPSKLPLGKSHRREHGALGSKVLQGCLS